MYNICGIITPEVLIKVESGQPIIDEITKHEESLSYFRYLEIRYDLFNKDEWQTLIPRVRKFVPDVKIIGTFRIERDGGKLKDIDIFETIKSWSETELPDLIDVPYDDLSKYKDKIDKYKILLSKHDFEKIPNIEFFDKFIKDAQDIGVFGIKFAGYTEDSKDYNRVYNFTKKSEDKFKLVAGFVMGERNKETRAICTEHGANLVYTCIDKPIMPGQYTRLEYLNTWYELIII